VTRHVLCGNRDCGSWIPQEIHRTAEEGFQFIGKGNRSAGHSPVSRCTVICNMKSRSLVGRVQTGPFAAEPNTSSRSHAVAIAQGCLSGSSRSIANGSSGAARGPWSQV